jgi:predicted negative regulator of RcsB-dependent stress response
MMNEVLNDDQQVEALKKWWKENGKSIIGGAVLGLLAVGGWQYWQDHTKRQAELASAWYEQFRQTVLTGEALEIEARGKRLLEDFPDSTYSVFAALEMARADYETDSREVAEQYLQWALDNADEEALKRVVELRLARLRLDRGDIDGAAKLVTETGQGFAGEFAMLRGEIAAAKGDTEAARAAYRDALKQGVGAAALIEMKLAELGDDPAAL